MNCINSIKYQNKIIDIDNFGKYLSLNFAYKNDNEHLTVWKKGLLQTPKIDYDEIDEITIKFKNELEKNDNIVLMAIPTSVDDMVLQELSTLTAMYKGLINKFEALEIWINDIKKNDNL
jgi:hypothetical protein